MSAITAHVGSVGTGAAPTLQEAKLTVLLSSVTVPFRAKALPTRLAPLFIVMDVSARMLPTNVVVVSMVAELLTSHCTLQELPVVVTVEPGEVMSELDIWKVHEAEELPSASRMSVPVLLEAAAVTQ